MILSRTHSNMFIVRSRSFGFTGAACGTLRQLRAAEACWGPSEYDVRGGGSQIEDGSTERLRECHSDRIRDPTGCPEVSDPTLT